MESERRRITSEGQRLNGPRRYDDQEIAEILERATTGRDGQPVLPGNDGLTLDELEQIGTEVGIHPDRIAAAARSLDSTAPAVAVERFLGAPRSVARTLRIERALTEEEWARLVGDLRRTFNAKGRLEQHGTLRSWSNSNLQVHVEPDGDGYVVRMSTRKGNATQLTMMGTVFGTIGVATGIGVLLGTSDEVMQAALMTGAGAGLIAWVRATLPAWARERAQQMEGLAERIPRLLRE